MWLWSPFAPAPFLPFKPPHPSLRLWPRPRTCFQSLTGIVLSMVQTVPSSRRPSVLDQSRPNPITFRVFSPGSPPGSLHSLCVAKMCSVHTRGSTEKPRESTNEFNINISAAFFQILRKNAAGSRFSLTEMCSDSSSARWAPGGTRAIPPAAGTLVDQETKMRF